MSTPKSINVAVAEQVEKLGSEKVISTVIEKLVQSEVTRRADALCGGNQIGEEALREFRKLDKADQVSISHDGVKTETYSQKAFEARKKAEDRMKKIDNAVVAATENGEWSKLYDLTKGGNQAPAETKADDAQ